MSEAHYSVIRYVPDPGRGERLNLGILVWSDEAFALRVDDEAVKRVIRENPLLDRHALLYVDSLLRSFLEDSGQTVASRIDEMLSGRMRFPINLSEPRFTTLAEGSEDALNDTLDRLNERVVTPKRRTARGGETPFQRLEKDLQTPLRRGAVARHHFFETSRTGLPRAVDFYANSSCSTALDAVQLDIENVDQIVLRADAEAFKVEDIVAKNDVRFVVYCAFSTAHELAHTNDNARRIIESVGADVVTSSEDAAKKVMG